MKNRRDTTIPISIVGNNKRGNKQESNYAKYLLLILGFGLAIMCYLYFDLKDAHEEELEQVIADQKLAMSSVHADYKKQLEHLNQQLQAEKDKKPPPAAPQPNVPATQGVISCQDLHKRGTECWGYESPLITPCHLEDPAVIQKFSRTPNELEIFNEVEMNEFWNKAFVPLKNTRNTMQIGIMQMFNEVDSFIWYLMVRYIKPNRIIEIGSGESTQYAKQAIQHASLPTELICIEPFRAKDHDYSGTTLIEKRLETVDDELFTKLQAGDILFIDSSHVIKPFGDTIYELVYLLPKLPVGVIVHVHDIFLPAEYHRNWICNQKRHYTEQYMLAAFLYGNTKWKVLWSNGYHKAYGRNPFRELSLSMADHGGSIYIQKIA